MISEKITSELLFSVTSLLEKAQNIVIVSHMSPDGDAMGSSLGFGHVLRAAGKKVTNIVPNAYPSFLAWMPGADEIRIYDGPDASLCDEKIAAADLVICTDFNEPKRIGAVGQVVQSKVAQGCPWIILDHHLTQSVSLPDNQGIALIDASAPAASVLVYRLLRELSLTIGLDAATCLYTGIMTDTGNFSFNSNYPYLYHIIADLLALGVDKDACYNAVFNQHSADRMRLVGYCLKDKMRIFPEHHAALIYLSRRELYRHNFQSGDAEGIVNLPLQIADVFYSVFMREDKLAPWEKALHPDAKTKVKISFRSQGDRPVNIFAHEIFHGGGHANASGGEYYGASVAEAVQLFLDNYKSYFICS